MQALKRRAEAGSRAASSAAAQRLALEAVSARRDASGLGSRAAKATLPAVSIAPVLSRVKDASRRYAVRRRRLILDSASDRRSQLGKGLSERFALG